MYIVKCIYIVYEEYVSFKLNSIIFSIIFFNLNTSSAAQDQLLKCKCSSYAYLFIARHTVFLNLAYHGVEFCYKLKVSLNGSHVQTDLLEDQGRYEKVI